MHDGDCHINRVWLARGRYICYFARFVFVPGERILPMIESVGQARAAVSNGDAPAEKKIYKLICLTELIEPDRAPLWTKEFDAWHSRLSTRWDFCLFFCILHSKVGWHSAPYFFSNEIWHQPKRKTSKILSSMDMKAFRINGISFIESILEVNQRWMQHRLADSSARCQCLPIMCLNRHENNASQRQKMYRFDGGGLNLIKILL